jgi:4-methylaminobutanoate oxidase (formaldehyde-forming)
VRVTFVGELGWELYCPCEYAVGLWDSLMAAGSPHGLVPGGYRAIESLRLEKGYRVWGSDVTTTDSPFEAGLGFAVKIKKGEFIGRDALDRAGEPTRRLACLVLDEAKSVVLGSEPVRFEGRALGRVTSGGYGYSVESSIAYAYLPAELVVPGTRVSVGMFGRDVGAEVRAEPLFDPGNEKVRA